MTARLADLTPEQAELQRERSRLYRERTRAKRVAYGAAYHRRKYATDPAYRARKDKQAARARLKTRYGVTPEQVEAARMQQGNRCAICSCTLTRFHIDHCHKTGRFRALLCAGCNVFVGKIEKDKARTKAALAYIEKHTDG